jgi:hypothetical protein
MTTTFLRAHRRLAMWGLAALILIGCSGSSGSGPSNNTPLDPTAFGNKYKFADNEVSGWTQSTDPTDPFQYGVYSDADLDQRIDGGNMAYISRGMRVAMFQNLVGPAGAVCTVVAMDFGTADNATTMFNYEKDTTSAATAIPSYDASTAIGYETLSGVTAYAHFKTSYFETQVSGVADAAAGAEVGGKLLQVLASKTK